MQFALGMLKVTLPKVHFRLFIVEKEYIMGKSKSLKVLAVVFFVSGIWDLIGGINYAFMVGTVYTEPPVHRFYAIFLATFFICFAYLQCLSAFNIKRYLFIVGSVLIGRILYVILLYAYILGEPGFPKTFWWTGVVDFTWSVLYIIIAQISDEIRIRDLFVPARRAAS
jgi:hypothetical protein